MHNVVLSIKFWCDLLCSNTELGQPVSSHSKYESLQSVVNRIQKRKPTASTRVTMNIMLAPQIQRTGSKTDSILRVKTFVSTQRK